MNPRWQLCESAPNSSKAVSRSAECHDLLSNCFVQQVLCLSCLPLLSLVSLFCRSIVSLFCMPFAAASRLASSSSHSRLCCLPKSGGQGRQAEALNATKEGARLRARLGQAAPAPTADQSGNSASTNAKPNGTQPNQPQQPAAQPPAPAAAPAKAAPAPAPAAPAPAPAAAPKKSSSVCIHDTVTHLP